jgi:CRISPR-associated protein Csm4
MGCHIVYLKPVGAGGFKAELRSDTLWASLCWAIRSILGEAALEETLAAYESLDEAEAFYISSAFPYLEEKRDEEEVWDKVCFFPKPLQPYLESRPLDIEGLTPEEIKMEVRKAKRRDKRLAFLPKSQFEYLIRGNRDPIGAAAFPETISRPMTHNTIDRLSGSTLTIKENETDKEGRGQLFHTDEFYLKNENTGLFFLLRGNLEKVKPALRYLEHEGLGGDRSIGKGRFEISEPEDFSISTPATPNALVNLSLYHPTEKELKNWLAQDRDLLNYRLENRLGRVHLQKEHLHDKAVLFFKEGSVFPLQAEHKRDNSIYGRNVVTGKHSAGFDIRRYGHGFMINAKII